MQTLHLLMILFCVSLASCDFQASLPPFHPPKPSTMQEMNEFTKPIKQIGNEVKRLDVPDELFAPQSFRDIYENPQAYFALASALIGHKDLSAHEKKIIGYAMQNLPAEQFVMFVSLTADSVDQGLTGMDVLVSTSFAPLNWGRQSLIMHSQQAPVQALLVRLSQMTQMPDSRKRYIQDKLLTGQAKQDFLAYRDMLGRPVQE